jgi:hypothetical protein
MGYADRYRCSGCSLIFGDPAEWRVQDRAPANSAQARVIRDAPHSSLQGSGGL